MPRSTVHRIAQMLVDDGILTYEEATERYDWGAELYRIAQAVQGSSDFGHFVLPIMREVMLNTGETVVLARYDYATHTITYTEEVECAQPLRYHVALGVPLPAHAGATGKAIMAFLPDSERRQIITSGLDRLTERTVVDERRLQDELAAIRRQRVAITHGERTPDAVGLAGPIFDRRGAVIGSLVVTIPEYRYDASREQSVVAEVRRAADAISRLLGAPESTGEAAAQSEGRI